MSLPFDRIKPMADARDLALPVTIMVHGVEHRGGGAAARTLSKNLLARISEWNPRAIANGLLPV
jgi:hypothetical protein